MKLEALVVAIALFWPESVFSDELKTGFETGNQLFEACSAARTTVDYNFCLGYVAGMSDIFAASDLICIPKNAPIGLFADVITKYLRDHPESRQLSATSEGHLALSKAFPCK